MDTVIEIAVHRGATSGIMSQLRLNGLKVKAEGEYDGNLPAWKPFDLFSAQGILDIDNCKVRKLLVKTDNWADGIATIERSLRSLTK